MDRTEFPESDRTEFPELTDVNGDGYADFLIGAFGASPGAGAAHLYLGEALPSASDWNVGTPPPKRIDLTNPDGANAVFGYSVASAGDVNGDGYADFLIGAYNASSGTGAAHLYLGEALPSASDWNVGTPPPKRIDLTSPDGAYAHFGSSVASAGDVNGDGYADFLIGAYGASSNAGAAHLYLGEALPSASDWNVGTPPPKRIDLTNPDGANALFGYSVASAGDVNGDGYADFLIGAFGASSAAGAAHLYLGEALPSASDWNVGTPPPKRIDLTSPDGANASFGYSVASAGDVNGDGYADFLIGAYNASSGTGAAHLYLGEALPSASDWNVGTPPPKRIDLTSPDGANAEFGSSVASAGDVNGDGYADFLIGAYGTSSAAGARNVGAHLRGKLRMLGPIPCCSTSPPRQG